MRASLVDFQRESHQLPVTRAVVETQVVHPLQRRMAGDDDVLELGRDRSEEVAKHEHDAPRLNAGDVPLELCLGKRSRRVAHDSHLAVVLDLGQAAAHTPWCDGAIALEPKAPVKLRVGQRSALRTLKRFAYVESLRLALSGPSRSKYGSIVVLSADLQALAHVASALCIVFEISSIEAAEAQPRLHVLHHPEVLKVRHLGYIGRCR